MRNTSNKRISGPIAALAVLASALSVTACGSDDGGNDTTAAESSDSALPTGSEPANLDPAEFTTEIDNPYWPMTPGSKWVYRETDAKAAPKRVVVTVTDRTKQIANGIEARVVRDVVSENGEAEEITDDWYAQDADGNIWYLGEDTAEYKNGKVVSREGSFEAGVDGAEAGVLMPADPQPGLEYRQEYLKDEAEDFAKVLGLDATAEVPFGSYTGLLQTKDVNPLDDPPQVENKYYAEGVGMVLTIDIGSDNREELVSYTPGG